MDTHKRSTNDLTALLVIVIPVLLSVILFSAAPIRAVHMPFPEWTEVDRIVATINGNPVMVSDLMIEHDFGLLEHPQREANSIDDLIEPFLNRLLILEEIGEVGGFSISKTQAEGAFRGYMMTFGGDSAFRSKTEEWGAEPVDIKRRLTRALTASLYTESRIRFFVNILPSDIEDAYRKDPDRWGEGSLFAVWNTIKETLQGEAFKRERNRWLASLKTRYNLHMINGNNGGLQ